MTMHGNLSTFLSRYIDGLRDRAPHPEAAQQLTALSRRVTDYDAETLECLYERLALWLDAGASERDVAERLVAAEAVCAE